MKKWADITETFRKSYDFRQKHVNWFPGHMSKGLRQMQHIIFKTDCIIEVHDARLPLTGRNSTFRDTLVGERPHLLVLSKQDLAFGPVPTKESDRLKARVRDIVLSRDPSLSDVIFANCSNAACKGLKSVSGLIPHRLSKNAPFDAKNLIQSNFTCDREN